MNNIWFFPVALTKTKAGSVDNIKLVVYLNSFNDYRSNIENWINSWKNPK